MECSLRVEIGKPYPDRRNNRNVYTSTFWCYMNKQCGITKIVHILSYSIDCQTLNQGGEGLSVSSTTQGTETMSGEQTGTCSS